MFGMTLEAILFIFIVVLLTYVGGIFIARKESKVFFDRLPLFMSLGTGVLLTIAVNEFIPHAFKDSQNNSPWWILGGILFVIVADKYIAPYLGPRHDRQCSHHSHGPKLISSSAACSSIGCIIVCAFMDGVEIYTAFHLGTDVGWFLAFGLFFHVVPEGAIAAGLSLAGGFSKEVARKSVIYIASAILLGLLVGSQVVKYISFENTLLPFASGVLLYVSIGHLMPVSLKSRWGLWGVIFGAGLIFILRHLSGHSH
ncbi:MAG: hypothetical protein KDD40_12785 [Bdellovibrionales bacterium]|nr:hypothetical protein [Bdellovibrionales bacterium]